MEAIDPGARTLRLGGEVLEWDMLALATGSRPRRLPAAMGGDLAGVFTLRDIADVDAMRDRFRAGCARGDRGGRLHRARGGGGVAAELGLDVTVVEAAARILQRVASPQTSDWFRALHRSHGVRILEGTGLERLTGDAHVEAARLADGRDIAADFVMVGVGVAPETALAEASGLAIDNGIATDAQGRTSVPGIWAAGDCASFPWRGGRLRLESVQNAIDQAEHVAMAMLGRSDDYRPMPWFWSDQYDAKLQIAGLNAGYTSVATRGTGDAVSFWYYAGDRLVAVDAVNDARAFMVAKRLIAADRSPAPEVVTDPATDLRALLA